MKQIEVQILQQSYLLSCPEGHESRLLDAVERGLVNFRPASGATVEAVGEEQLQRVVLGRHLYGQRYRVKALVSQL